MSSVRKIFNNASKSYNDAAFLQKEIANRLLEKLNPLKLNPESILDLGSGTGIFSDLVSNKYSPAKIISLDFAINSITSNNADFKVCANANQLPFKTSSIDFVCSNLMLQWIQDPSLVFNEINRVLKPNSLFFFSSFGPDTLNELKSSWAVVDRDNHVNNFIDMHDLGDQLTGCGFQSPVMEMEKITLTYSEVEDLMFDLKSLGANKVFNQSKGLVGKNKFTSMKNMYESYRTDGKIPATYEVIYGHAWTASDIFSPINLENR